METRHTKEKLTLPFCHSIKGILSFRSAFSNPFDPWVLFWFGENRALQIKLNEKIIKYSIYREPEWIFYSTWFNESATHILQESRGKKQKKKWKFLLFSFYFSDYFFSLFANKEQVKKSF